MAGDGYVKLWRKTLDSAAFSGDHFLTALWVWCLLKANWKDGWFRGDPIPAGSFATGSEAATELLCVSKWKLWRGLRKLESLGQITLKVQRKYTIVTVCNWQTYQSQDDDECNERATNVQRKPNGNQTETGTIEERQERKEDKEGKKNTPLNPPKGETARMISVEDLDIPEAMDRPEFREAVKEWLAYKRAKKQAYKSAAHMERLIKQFHADFGDRATVEFVRAVQRSIANNYSGCFPDSGRPGGQPTQRPRAVDSI